MGASPQMSFAIAAGVEKEHYRALMSSCTSMAVSPQPSRPPWWEGTFGTANRVSIEEESKALTGCRFEMVKLEVQQARAVGPRNASSSPVDSFRSTSIEELAYLDCDAASASAVVGSRVKLATVLEEELKRARLHLSGRSALRNPHVVCVVSAC